MRHVVHKGSGIGVFSRHRCVDGGAGDDRCHYAVSRPACCARQRSEPACGDDADTMDTAPRSATIARKLRDRIAVARD